MGRLPCWTRSTDASTWRASTCGGPRRGSRGPTWTAPPRSSRSSARSPIWSEAAGLASEPVIRWRSMRIADLQPGWDVLTNDGHRLGTVREVGQQYIEVSGGFFSSTLYVPASAIGNVEG